MSENNNRIYKQCRFFENDETCRAIQPDMNCYQCEISRYKIAQLEVERLKKEKAFLIKSYEKTIKNLERGIEIAKDDEDV